MLTSDSYYKNRAVVRRIVAALCAFDNQMLGKVLTIIALDYDSIDLTFEAQARRWFEQRIRTHEGFWVSRLVLVLDQLLLAFKFYRPTQVVSQKHCSLLDWK
jgi:hypothetical protein